MSKKKKKTTLMPKEEVQQAFDAYLEKFKEMVRVVGQELIEHGVVGEDPFQHTMLAIGKIAASQDHGRFDNDSNNPPPGTMFN